jgi:hypothetical protein
VHHTTYGGMILTRLQHLKPHCDCDHMRVNFVAFVASVAYSHKLTHNTYRRCEACIYVKQLHTVAPTLLGSTGQLSWANMSPG